MDIFESEINQGSLPQAIESASRLRDLFQNSAKVFSDESIEWPEKVVPLIKELRDYQISNIAYFDLVSKSQSIDEALAVPLPDFTYAEVAQEVRVELDLPADTNDSCNDYK